MSAGLTAAVVLATTVAAALDGAAAGVLTLAGFQVPRTASTPHHPASHLVRNPVTEDPT